MRKLLMMAFFIAASAHAEDGCLIVRGYDLCEDAKIIASNTEKDIGLYTQGTEYVLESVTSDKMRVISTHRSIYTESEAIERVKKMIAASSDKNLSVEAGLKAINDYSTKRLCKFYSQDEFVNDGGAFEVIYRYKDGKIINHVLAEKDNCRALSSHASEEKPEAQYTIEVLDSFCIQNQHNFSDIVHMAESYGGKVLPNGQGDPAIRELGGKTVYVPYENRKYMVAFANGGGCSVVATKIDHNKLKEILVKYFKIRLLDKQESLSQVSEMFEVKAKGAYYGSMLSLVYAQPETGFTDGSISFIPSTTVNSALGK